MNDFMRIGELSERAGVTTRTIRYYEDLGLIPVGKRKGNGQHYYTEETLKNLRKIEQLKNIGLSLEEIRDVSVIYFNNTDGDINVVKVEAKHKILEILHRHLTDTDRKIEALQEFHNDLVANIKHYEQLIKDHQK